MRRVLRFVMRRGAAAGIALLVVAAGCTMPGTGSPWASEPDPATPAQHYRSFADADALATYLRADSDAGPLVGAHRGGPMPGFPENALATFHHSLRYGPVLLECDVRRTADSTLVLMHDATLDRTTTGEGPVADASLAEIRRLQLVDPAGRVTSFGVPTLDEALAWAEGRAVLQLDVKDGVAPAAVLDAVRRADAFNRVVVLTYSVAAAADYQARSDRLIVSAPAESPEEAQELLQRLDPTRLVSFIGVGTLRPAVIDRLRAAGVRVTVGTFGDWDETARRDGPAVYRRLVNAGIGILATDAVPLAARAVRQATDPPAPNGRDREPAGSRR